MKGSGGSLTRDEPVRASGSTRVIVNTPVTSSGSGSSYSSYSPLGSTYDARVSNKGATYSNAGAGSRKSISAALNPAASKAGSAVEFLQHQAAVCAWLEELSKSAVPCKDHSPAAFLAAVANGVLLCRAMQTIDERGTCLSGCVRLLTRSDRSDPAYQPSADADAGA